jgi:hypothetical protein
VWGLDLVGSL